MIKIKQICADCHYFFRNKASYKFPILNEQRVKVKNNDYSWLDEQVEAVACYREIWDENYEDFLNNRHEIICEINRKNKCFFWKFQPGTNLKKAIELHDKIEQRKLETRKYRLAIYGLILMILGLIITMFFKCKT